MHAIYGLDPIGLNRRPAYERLYTNNFNVKYPDSTCLKNNPLMTQFDYICMFELEEEQRRDMIERRNKIP